MKRFRGSMLGLLSWLLLCLFASCANTSSGEGTDSNTHWLEVCEDDADCGSLSCVCGVCTKTCDTGSECVGLGARAACEASSDCGGDAAPSVCVRASGGGGSSAGGSTAAAGSGGGSTADCSAMDVRGVPGASCDEVLGYFYNGKICTQINCGCAGDDCANLFASIAACDAAHGACYARVGVSQVCSTHEDCRVAPRTCCEACSTPDSFTRIAVSDDSAELRDAGICLGEPTEVCGECGEAEPDLYSACVEGACRMLEVSDFSVCESDDDCLLRTKDCCDCGGDFSSSGLLAVNSSFLLPDYCPADVGCAECEAPTPPSGVRARCSTTRGRCELVIVP